MVDPTTNQLSTTDVNGNSWYGPDGSNLVYDAENRVTRAAYSTVAYAYEGQNKRIWACKWASGGGACQTETYYFYSPQGKLLAQFAPYDAPPS